MSFYLRKILLLLATLALSMSLSTSALAKKGKGKEPRKWKTITYSVKKGDTLGSIAQKYDTSPAKLKSWNKGLSPKKLQIGQRLKIAVLSPEWQRWKSGKSPKRKRNKPVAKKSSKADSSSSLPPKMVAATGSDTAAPPKNLTVPAPGFDDTPDLIPAKPAPKRGAQPDFFEFKGEKLPVVTSTQMLDEGTKRAVYIAARGENVGVVAMKFGLDPEDILHWNKLDRLTLNPEEPVVFTLDAKPRVPKKPLPVVHRVKRGDNYQKIAKKYGVSIKQLKRWNPKVKPSRLQIGQRIHMHIPGKDGRSASYGTANRGRLYNGVALESTHGLHVRTVANTYGTQRVVNLLKAAAFDVQARWPDAPNLVVGDISYRRGGRIKRHKSHQSGRDADISFYYRGNVQTRDFIGMEGLTFDAVKNWHIFKTLIDTGEVEFIFIDYPLQKILYEYAISIGYTPEELLPILQYPRPRSMSAGIIRHVRGHADHWHIRFRCGPTDRHCR